MNEESILNTNGVTLRFFGENISYPGDLQFFVIKNKYLIKLTPDFSEKYLKSANDDYSISITSYVDIIEEYGKILLTELAKYGIYNKTLSDFTSNNTGLKKVKNLIENFSDLVQGKKDKYDDIKNQEINSAIKKANKSVDGLGFGVITGSLSSAFLYEYMNSRKLKNQINFAQHQLKEQSKEIQASISKQFNDEIENYYINSFIPLLYEYTNETLSEMRNSFFAFMREERKINLDFISLLNVKKSIELLENLNFVVDKKSIIKESIKLSPFTVNVYYAAYKYDLLDEDLRKIIKYFQMEEELLDFTINKDFVDVNEDMSIDSFFEVNKRILTLMDLLSKNSDNKKNKTELLLRSSAYKTFYLDKIINIKNIFNYDDNQYFEFLQKNFGLNYKDSNESEILNALKNKFENTFKLKEKNVNELSTTYGFDIVEDAIKILQTDTFNDTNELINIICDRLLNRFLSITSEMQKKEQEEKKKLQKKEEEKKKRIKIAKYLSLICGGILLFIFLFSTIMSMDIFKTKVNLVQACDVTFEGNNEEGQVKNISCTTNLDASEQNEKVKKFLEHVDYSFTGDYSSEDELKNGDTLNLKAIYDKSEAKNANIVITKDSKIVEVEGLTEYYETWNDVPYKLKNKMETQIISMIKENASSEGIQTSDGKGEKITVNSISKVAVFYGFNYSKYGCIVYIYKANITSEYNGTEKTEESYYAPYIEGMTSEYMNSKTLKNNIFNLDFSDSYIENYDDQTIYDVVTQNLIGFDNVENYINNN